MSLLSLTTDVLPYLKMAADDSYGNVSRIHLAMEKYAETCCNRVFESDTYEEKIPSFVGGNVNLKNYPIISVSNVTTELLRVVRVRNTNAYTTATVQVTSTGVILAYNGAVNTVLFSAYSTLGAVVTQINAVGSGWDAQIASSAYAGILSTSLMLEYGQAAIDNREVWLTVLGANIGYTILDADAGVLNTAPPFAYTSVARTLDRPLYVVYTAGYTVIPKDLKQAILTLIAYQYGRVMAGAEGVNSFSIADYSVTYDGGGNSGILRSVMRLLDNYKNIVF